MSALLFSIAFMPFIKQLDIILIVLPHNTFCALQFYSYNYILTIKHYSYYFISHYIVCIYLDFDFTAIS